MRVRFGELSDAESAERERVCARGREAWECLLRGATTRARYIIESIDERLLLSVAPASSGHPACVELATFESSLWPLAELLLSQLPADAACGVSLGRGARSLSEALALTEHLYRVDLSRATARAGFARGHLLEITLAVPGGSGAEREEIAAENLVRELLGDRLFETWIGAVRAAPAPRGGALRVLTAGAAEPALVLDDLYDTVAAAARGVLRGLPEAARAPEPAEPRDDAAAQDGWTLLEVEPLNVAQEFGKKDLVLASTCTPELLRCFLDGSPCSSRRFSRDGERFVYVGYADDERRPERRVERRSELEAALRDGLRGAGRVTGVGLGTRTTYLDLALFDLETGLPLLVSKLRELAAPRRSFIQFFDSELSEEWLSIWPDSRLTPG